MGINDLLDRETEKLRQSVDYYYRGKMGKTYCCSFSDETAILDFYYVQASNLDSVKIGFLFPKESLKKEFSVWISPHNLFHIFDIIYDAQYSLMSLAEIAEVIENEIW